MDVNLVKLSIIGYIFIVCKSVVYKSAKVSWDFVSIHNQSSCYFDPTQLFLSNKLLLMTPQ